METKTYIATAGLGGYDKFDATITSSNGTRLGKVGTDIGCLLRWKVNRAVRTIAGPGVKVKVVWRNAGD